MKKFICPVCDQSDIVKENDLFVCQGCGTKYHAEEVRESVAETDSIPEISHKLYDIKPETVLARSVSATNKINNWQKNVRVNSLIGALMPATIFLVVPFLAMVEEMTLSEVFRRYPFISTLSSCCAIAFGALIFIADKKIKESVSVADRARNTANKESIVVTNTRIFGSTNTQSFSVPISEIKNTYIERKLGKSSSVISNEVLRVICEKETLCFEFFENNSEISNAIKTALPPKSDYRTTDNITKNSDHKDNSDVYNIKITDYATYLSAIKAIREITLTDYVSAKQFLDKLPAVLVENAPKEKADKYARILEQNDVNFEIYRS